VLAGLKQHSHYEQIRIGEEPAIGSGAGSFGDAADKSKVAALGEVTQVVQADSSQPGDFIFGEELLSRFYSQHLGS
jgi:hypothetical protein